MLRRSALFLTLLTGLWVGPNAFADAADLAALRGKAETGNSIAQYNLGLSYATGRDVAADLPEAYVWLSLASINGTTGKALNTLLGEMTPAQLAEGQRRLAEYRNANPNAAKSTGIEADSHKLTTELALANQNTDELKRQLDDALHAQQVAQADLRASTKELAILRARAATTDSAPNAYSANAAAVLQREVAQLKAAATTLGSDNQKLEDIAAQRGRELNEAQSQLASLKQDDAMLRQQLGQALNQNDTLGKKLQANQVGTTQSQSADAEQIKTLSSDLAELKTRLSVEQSARTAVDRKYDSTSQELAKTRNALSAGGDELVSLRIKVSQLENQQNDRQSSETTALQTQLKQLQAQSADLSAHSQMLEGIAAQRGRDLTALQTSLQQTKDQLAQAATERASLEAQLKAARTEVTQPDPAATQRIAALGNELKSLKEQLTAEQAAHRQAVANSQNESLRQKKFLGEQQQLLTDLNIEKTRQQQELAAAQQNVETLERNQVAARATTTQPDLQTTEQIATLKGQVEQLKTKLSQADSAQKDSTAKWNALDATNRKLRDEQTAQQKALTGARAEISALQDKLIVAHSAGSQPDEATTSRIAALNRDLQAAKSQLALAQGSRTDTTAQVDSMASDLGAVRVQLSRLQDENIKLSTRLEEATTATKTQPDLKAKLAAATAAQQSAEMKTEALEIELATTQKNLADSKTQAAHVPADQSAELAALQSKVSAALSSYTKLQSENDQLKTKSDRLASQVASLETQLANAPVVGATETDSVATEAPTVADPAELVALREQVQAAQEERDAAQANSEQLRDRLLSLRTVPTRPGSTTAVSIARTPALRPAPTPSAPRNHVVVSGDTLSGLSLRYYGSPQRWAEIYEANRSKLPNPRALRVGMNIVIP